MNLHHSQGSFLDAPIRLLPLPGGTSIAYRAIGSETTAPPLLVLIHLAAALDHWDPLVLDRLAEGRRVIAIDYPGIGMSTGAPASTIEDAARGVIDFLDAAHLEVIDLLGLSFGGFVAQQVLLDAGHRVRRTILAGSGPAGGEGISRIPGKVLLEAFRSGVLRRDPRHRLFFPATARREAEAFMSRSSGYRHPDRPISPKALLAQLRSVHDWARRERPGTSSITSPILLYAGREDVLVPASNSQRLKALLSGARLVPVRPGAGHGAPFQEPEVFCSEVIRFLGEDDEAH